MGIFLCIVAFIATFAAARRSVVAGLGSLAAVGYFYGILRANYPETASHFIFDAAVFGFYLVNLFQKNDEETSRRSRAILPWLALLVAWPVILLFFPLQEPLVQLVGLRGNIFLLPFLLVGARLTREELRRFAMPLAGLNLVAFAFAATEYVIGLGPFFPHNSNTEIIYHSADVAGSQFRIPSTFTGSHAYAGTMVLTLPVLVGTWAALGTSSRRRLFLLVSIFASILGVFAAASRVHIVVLGLVILATLFSGRISIQLRAVVLALAAIVAIIVLSEARLQRISTLQDSNYLSQRVGGSVNAGFLDLLVEYPFGNGLGGGGTSLPYFLENRVRHRVVMENEYARILLEQTCIGLCIWIAFILWFVFRRFSAIARTWDLTEQLSWAAVCAYFGTALIGIGLLTSIPQSMLLFLCMGSVTSWRMAPYLEFGELSSDLVTTLYEPK
jgi:hypothetical protein